MISRESVLKAAAEFDQLGREAFLAKYGYGTARDYFVALGGTLYDSKALYGVAHKFEGDRRALESADFTGGIGGAAARLKALGFEVIRSSGDPDWTWDEHVLALDLYLRLRNSKFSKGHRDIATLSALLNAFARRRGWVVTGKFRNIEGVYMKLMNFRRFDPIFLAQGKVGLQRGNKHEETAWNRYAGDPVALAEAVKLIRFAIDTDDVDLASPVPDEAGYEAEEGALVQRLHWARERDPKLARKKREQVLAAQGALRCEVCQFDFSQHYPKRGAGFAEVHHTLPVSSLTKPTKTKLDDLAIVCANCHRMLHRGGLISLAELRAMLGA